MFKKCPFCGKLIIIGSHDHSTASNGNRKGRGGYGDGRSICA